MNPSENNLSGISGDLSSVPDLPVRSPVPGEKRQIAVLSLLLDTDAEGSAGIEERTISRFIELIAGEIASCVSICAGEFDHGDDHLFTVFFGIGREAEQACRRAVDCAFRIRRTVSMINASISRETSSLKFSVRSGLDYGLAPVSTGRNGSSRITGKSVDLARLLMESAAPDALLVSEEAKRACGNYYSWERMSSGTCKKVWSPVGKRDRPSVHPLLETLPLLGRDRELEQLQTSWASCTRCFTHPPVLITGKPGIGKTRLLEAFLESVDQKSVRIVRLENRLWDQPPLGMWLPLLDAGFFDPYGSIMARIRDLRKGAPMILAVEDLHWADESSAKLLTKLARSICDTGVFLVMTSRSLPEGDLGEAAGRITLDGLDRASVSGILQSMVGSGETTGIQNFTRFLMESASGNPLLVIEIILHCLETGILGRDNRGSWHMVREPDKVIPGSAESFLQARMSTLNSRERLALQTASVLGSGFTLDVFREVCRRLGCDSGEIILSRLINMGFLRSTHENSFSFSNSILSGTVYRTLIRENRILIHRTSAEVLSGMKAGTSITMARHWIESEAGKEALPWLFSALKDCIDLGDMVRADTLSEELHSRVHREDDPAAALDLEYCDMRMNFTRGKIQTALEDAERLSDVLKGRRLAYAMFVRGQCRENLGISLQDVSEEYISAAEEAEKAGDLNIRATALASAGAVLMSIGKRNKALECLTMALEHKDSLDSPSLAKLHGNMGILLRRTGNNGEALEHLSTTLELGRKCGNTGIQANALAFMGHTRISMGSTEEGLDNLKEALAMHRKAGNRRGECSAMGSLGGQLARFGDVDEGIEMLEQAIVIAEEIGHTRGKMAFHSNLGVALQLRKDYQGAEYHIRKSIEMLSGSDDKRSSAVAHMNLSSVLIKLSRLAEATEEARRSLRFACAVDSLSTQIRALSNLGLLMLETDRPEMSRNFFKEAGKRCSLSGDNMLLSDIIAGEGIALAALGEVDKASECYEKAVDYRNKYGIDGDTDGFLERLAETLNEQSI